MRLWALVIGVAALAGCANCPGPNCAAGRFFQGYAQAAQQQRAQTCSTTCHNVAGYVTCETTCP